MRLLAAAMALRTRCFGSPPVGFKFGSDYFESGLRGFLAGGVAAQAVDYQENAEGVVHIAAILILGAQTARVGECGGSPFSG